MIRSVKVFEQLVYGAAYRQSAISDGGHSGDPEPPSEGARINAPLIGVSSELVERMDGRIRESSFGRLEEAADR